MLSIWSKTENKPFLFSHIEVEACKTKESMLLCVTQVPDHPNRIFLFKMGCLMAAVRLFLDISMSLE